MTLRRGLNVSEHDALFEWIEATANETGVGEETLWDIAGKFVLEPNSVEHVENELRLKKLYEIHLNRVKNVDQETLGSWVQVNFTLDGEKRHIQFSYGQFSVTLDGDDADAEAMEQICNEEGMEVIVNDADAIATRQDDRGAVWAVRVTKRILDEVHGASLGDVTWAEEDGVRELTWEDVVEDR